MVLGFEHLDCIRLKRSTLQGRVLAHSLRTLFHANTILAAMIIKCFPHLVDQRVSRHFVLVIQERCDRARPYMGVTLGKAEHVGIKDVISRKSW